MTTTTITASHDDENAALAMRARAGDKRALSMLIKRNLRLAYKLASKFRGESVDVDDLNQTASLGLSIAAGQWDPSFNVPFGAYASKRIMAELRAARMKARTIHTGNTRDGRKVFGVLPLAQKYLGPDATTEQLAEAIGVDADEVRTVMRALQPLSSLDAPIPGSDEPGETIGDSATSADDVNPEEDFATTEIRTKWHATCLAFGETLANERDRAIWIETLTSDDPVSLVDLGARYSVSKQRMGQLAARIKDNFRSFALDAMGPNARIDWL